MSNAARSYELPRAPMTPAIVRRLLGWSQIRVAALAGSSVSSVRIFEINPAALSPKTRSALESAYASMRAIVLSR